MRVQGSDLEMSEIEFYLFPLHIMNFPLNNEAIGLPSVELGPCETKSSKLHPSENGGVYSFHRNRGSKGCSVEAYPLASLQSPLFNIYWGFKRLFGNPFYRHLEQYFGEETVEESC